MERTSDTPGPVVDWDAEMREALNLVRQTHRLQLADLLEMAGHHEAALLLLEIRDTP